MIQNSVLTSSLSGFYPHSELNPFEMDSPQLDYKQENQPNPYLNKEQVDHDENNPFRQMDSSEQVLQLQDTNKIFEINSSNINEKCLLFFEKLNDTLRMKQAALTASDLQNPENDVQAYDDLIHMFEPVYQSIQTRTSLTISLFCLLYEQLDVLERNQNIQFITRKLLRIPNLIEVLQRPLASPQIDAIIETALKRVFQEQQDCDFVERIIEWLGEEEDFSRVCIKLSEIDWKKKKSQTEMADPYSNMYMQMMTGNILEIPDDRDSTSKPVSIGQGDDDQSRIEKSLNDQVNGGGEIDFAAEFITSQGCQKFLQSHFNLSAKTVLDNVVQAWLSLQENVYQLDETLIGQTIEIFSTSDGCVYLSQDITTQLCNDEPLLKFRILVTLIEQLGYHFAKVCNMAGDARGQDASAFGQKIFGGKIKMGVIDEKSQLVEYLINAENWSDIFSDKLARKFPYLISAN